MLGERQLAAKGYYGLLSDDNEDKQLNIVVCLRRLNVLGGDYFAIPPLYDNRILVFIFDAFGHDVSGALLDVRINTYLFIQAQSDVIARNSINSLNAYLYRCLAGNGIYRTFYDLLLGFESGEMTLSVAAHSPVFQYGKNQNGTRPFAARRRHRHEWSPGDRARHDRKAPNLLANHGTAQDTAIDQRSEFPDQFWNNLVREDGP